MNAQLQFPTLSISDLKRSTLIKDSKAHKIQSRLNYQWQSLKLSRGY